MSASETKRPIEQTPRAVAKWVNLSKPDTKYKDEGEYRIVILLKGKDADALKAKIDGAIAVAVAEAKANKENAKHLKKIAATEDLPYKPDTDKEGNENEYTQFRFKARASGKRKDGSVWTFKPRGFDNLGQPIDFTKVDVWGGTELKVAYEMQPYGVRDFSPKMGVGVSMKFSAVQILKLKTGTGKGASDFGFGVEEGEMPEEAGESEAPATDEEF
jgi:hypothetical protein